MKCDDVLINLPDYILDKVEPNLHRFIERHLVTCERCRVEFEELQDCVAVLGKVEVEEYPDSFWQELRSVIMEKVSVVIPAMRKVPVFAGVVAVVLLLVGIWVYRYEFGSVGSGVQSVTALASSLPPYEIPELQNLNINYVDVAAPPVAESEEITAVDDSTQEAIVNSMWADVTDSAVAADYYLDYPSTVISN
jgi:hypothetical protein